MRSPSSRLARVRPAIVALAAALACGVARADRDVPFVTTPDEAVNRMLEMAELTPRDRLIDLGSGDGRIVIGAAKRYGARGLGVDIDSNLVSISRDNARRAGVADMVDFQVQDLFSADLSEATVITMYLLPSINLRLRPKLLNLKPGTRIVSHDYGMGAWTPDRVTDSPYRINPVYLWIVPARVAGIWDVELPLSAENYRRYRIELTQYFQELSGRATLDGRTLLLSEPRVTGSKIEFQLRDEVQGRLVVWNAVGEADGDVMEGTVRVEGVSHVGMPMPVYEEPWRAVRVGRTAGN